MMYDCAPLRAIHSRPYLLNDGSWPPRLLLLIIPRLRQPSQYVNSVK